MTNNQKNLLRMIGLLALAFIWLGHPAQAVAGVEVDNAIMLDPFDPVPEIQFRHYGGYSWGYGCDGCSTHCYYDSCGRRHCYQNCNRVYRDCYGYSRCGGCRDNCGYRDGCRDRCGYDRCRGDGCYGDRRYDDCRQAGCRNWDGCRGDGCYRDGRYDGRDGLRDGGRDGHWRDGRDDLRHDDDRRGDDPWERYDDQADRYDHQSGWYEHHVIDGHHHHD